MWCLGDGASASQCASVPDWVVVLVVYGVLAWRDRSGVSGGRGSVCVVCKWCVSMLRVL